MFNIVFYSYSSFYVQIVYESPDFLKVVLRTGVQVFNVFKEKYMYMYIYSVLFSIHRKKENINFDMSNQNPEIEVNKNKEW